MHVTHSYTHCRFGVATRDVTPPVGIYARSWGAATHEVAEGVHRPFAATAAVFAPLDGDEPTLALVARRPRLVPALPDDDRELRATIIRAHRAGRRSAADQHVAHARRRERQLAARGQARRRAHPALPRAPGRADRRGDSRGARRACPRLGDVRDRTLRARDQPRFLGRRGGALRGAATTPPLPPTTRCWSRGSPARTASRARRSSTTPAIRRPSPGANRLLSPDYIGAAREVLERRLRRSRAVPAGRLGRAGSARRLRRRHGRRRPQRPPARVCRGGGDREPAAAGDALRLHGNRRVGRQPRHVGVPALATRNRSAPRAAGGARRPRPAPPQGGPRRRREPLRHPTRCRSRRRRCAAAT